MGLNIVRLFLAISACVTAGSVAANNDADYPQRLAALVNQYRASNGLPALIVDTTVARLAREHSAAMAKAGKLNHDDFPLSRAAIGTCHVC